MGKLTISMAIFNSFLYVYQRVLFLLLTQLLSGFRVSDMMGYSERMVFDAGIFS